MGAASPPIRMGEMGVARGGETLRTLLGSCIGLALYDRRGQIGGLAHIVLPQSNGRTDRPGKFVDTAIPALIAEIKRMSVKEPELRAKIAGGASMFATTVAATIGLQNIQSCEQLLSNLGIPIVGKHCGGKQGRRMTLHSANGRVVIEIVGEQPIEL